MEHPTIGRHRRPCDSMAGRVWALAAALLATALAALFSPRLDRLPRRVPRALSTAPAPNSVSGRDGRGGDLLADPTGFPEQRAWESGASAASTRWEQAYRERFTPFEEDRADVDPDWSAGALVRPYLARATVPRPRPAEPEDYPATPPAADSDPAEDEFAELTDRIRVYLAQRA
ncbi:hypothetical protein ACOQFV_07630 [Nocardiopsis changdeensis]|uniref:Secreted protein n=1 Tax=Nocardiopsis changdeensis TaxID=2831969 RepID=A0ABX8BE95_9ACTN|nr:MULTISPECIES: hypothetical protein [Nocardiopsis]QUX20565.1 hypothetical protein KGD84_18835 [Nocardiopsis changdeensis]QYX36496.1 hypothetical protein K1J57_28290 [Nocardiopsis sp. MT53]